MNLRIIGSKFISTAKYTLLFVYTKTGWVQNFIYFWNKQAQNLENFYKNGKIPSLLYTAVIKKILQKDNTL